MTMPTIVPLDELTRRDLAMYHVVELTRAVVWLELDRIEPESDDLTVDATDAIFATMDGEP